MKSETDFDFDFDSLLLAFSGSLLWLWTLNRVKWQSFTPDDKWAEIDKPPFICKKKKKLYKYSGGYIVTLSLISLPLPL